MKTWIITTLLGATAMHTIATQEDPYLWLEEIDSPRAMEWVNQQNAATTNALTQHPKFQAVYDKTLEILNSKELIAYPGIRGEYIYNFWRDDTYPRGVWRRTTFANYFTAKPDWDILLDISKLSEAEGETWAFKGVDALQPDLDRAMVRLSRGGGDAVVRREYDLVKRAFVEDGFVL